MSFSDRKKRQLRGQEIRAKGKCIIACGVIGPVFVARCTSCCQPVQKTSTGPYTFFNTKFLGATEERNIAPFFGWLSNISTQSSVFCPKAGPFSVTPSFSVMCFFFQLCIVTLTLIIFYSLHLLASLHPVTLL